MDVNNYNDVYINESFNNKNNNNINNNKNDSDNDSDNDNDDKSINQNNLRLIQINKYYSDEYKAYIDLLKVIVFFSLCILILSTLNKFEFIPEIFINGLIGLVLLLGISYSLWFYYDISLRDNINFYEYRMNKPRK